MQLGNLGVAAGLFLAGVLCASFWSAGNAPEVVYPESQGNFSASGLTREAFDGELLASSGQCRKDLAVARQHHANLARLAAEVEGQPPLVRKMHFEMTAAAETVVDKIDALDRAIDTALTNGPSAAIIARYHDALAEANVARQEYHAVVAKWDALADSLAPK